MVSEYRLAFGEAELAVILHAFGLMLIVVTPVIALSL
jgi:hypothetical protein